ncbi:unnamed protein product [Soboliphyme baturini]|uniref:MULE domain-containing protein n=1 Tax=Soboliphyme baturini TaxID=241478 RepID=A0A183IP18_9BILA|nr:unnamed protein product [Soboliphyme baturini]
MSQLFIVDCIHLPTAGEGFAYLMSIMAPKWCFYTFFASTDISSYQLIDFLPPFLDQFVSNTKFTVEGQCETTVIAELMMNYRHTVIDKREVKAKRRDSQEDVFDGESEGCLKYRFASLEVRYFRRYCFKAFFMSKEAKTSRYPLRRAYIEEPYCLIFDARHKLIIDV